jgi:putative methionine-R-sulfoxide reductase with GAF domain
MIVVPLIQYGRLMGVLDLDSPQLAQFDHEETVPASLPQWIYCSCTVTLPEL